MRERVITIAIVLFVLILSISPAFCQTPYEIFSLEFNIPSETGVDIIFIPANYTLYEMEKFNETVEAYYQTLLSIEPFSEFRDRINVWRIDTTEDFELQRTSGMDRLLTVNVSKVIQFVDSIMDFNIDNVLPDDLIIVLANDLTYGGSGASHVTVAYTGHFGKEVMMHELGHSYGHLGDEYVLYYQDFPSGHSVPYPNIDWDGSKWQDVPGTGAFLGAWYQNLVRPTNASCIMRTVSYSGFCPVCRRALVSIFENQSANGTLIEHELTISLDGSGSTYPSKTHTYEEGTNVTVTATASSGWIFNHWLLDSENVGSTNPYLVTIDIDHELTAVFTSTASPTPTPLTPTPTQLTPTPTQLTPTP
ncbi:MAG: M64 family metallopeptidase, partial [Candidatus Thorarchaeota archaeon]